MNIFLKRIKERINLTKEEEYYLSSFIRERVYQKNEFFIKPGQTCIEIGFIDFGLIRVFNINKLGKETTNWFSTDGDIITEILSFIKQVPSQEYFQCLENSKLFYITYTDLQKIYEKIPKMHICIKLIYEELLIDIKKNILSNIHLSAEERYEHFFRTKPRLIQKVSLKYIASFLGITDSTLSRVRKKIV